MKQWKWQKALVRRQKTRGTRSNLNDREVWMEVGRPQKIYVEDLQNNNGYVIGNMANLGGWGNNQGRGIFLDHREIEFLARGPEDFSDDVPLIPFEIWSKWT